MNTATAESLGEIRGFFAGEIFKFGFVGVFEFWLVGADVLDGPFRIPRKTLLGVRNLRGVEDVAPYIWWMYP